MDFSIPTSHAGLLPRALSSLEETIGEMNKADAQPSYTLQVKATLVASVAAAVLSVVDAVIHTAIFLVKAPFTALKITVGNLFGVGQYQALEAKEWFAHAQRVGKCACILINSVLFGAFAPTSVLALGVALKMMPKDAEVVAAPSSGAVSEPAKV